MTARILVDSNVLLDVIKADPLWGEWSARALAGHLERGSLVINPYLRTMSSSPVSLDLYCAHAYAGRH